jgi:hypothetical protein
LFVSSSSVLANVVALLLLGCFGGSVNANADAATPCVGGQIKIPFKYRKSHKKIRSWTPSGDKCGDDASQAKGNPLGLYRRREISAGAAARAISS